jgi:hypothetical protein
MRVTNAPAPTALEPSLVGALTRVRAERGFEAGEYARAKVSTLCAYMREHGLRACVVAVSGGIDSAVVFA